MQKFKIAHITWITYHNFGTFLQAYALQEVLKKLGYNSTLIDDRRYTNLYIDKKQILRAFIGLLIHPRSNFNFLRKTFKRSSYDKFASRYLKIDRKWKHTSDLSDKYHAFICGSDQIWSPILPSHHNGFYFLSFTDKPKIAYSPSLGTNSSTDEFNNKVRPWLLKFKSISVRESAGSSIVSKIIGREVSTTLDPTLLLDTDDWSHLLKKAPYQEPYILAYFLTFNEVYAHHAKLIATTKGIKLIIINGDPRLTKYADVIVKSAGPQEFINLVKYSQGIITDSYHGAIFSIHFERPILILKRFKDGAPNDQNSRIEELINICGLNNSYFIDENKISEISDFIYLNYDVIKKHLSKARSQSMHFLKNALAEI